MHFFALKIGVVVIVIDHKLRVTSRHHIALYAFHL